MNRRRTEGDAGIRSERGDGAEGAERRLWAQHREERALQLRAARSMRVIERSGHYRRHGCASIGQYGEHCGRSAAEARWLAAVGHMLELEPAIEEEVLSGRLSLEAAGALLQAYTHPALVESGVDWVHLARGVSVRRLRDAMEQVERQAATGERVSSMTVLLTASGKEDFRAARRLLSARRRRLVKRGEAVELLARSYLEKEDPARRKAAPRRMPDTRGRPGRAVPAAVVRELIARHGGRCPVPLCDHSIWMEKAHRVPHRRGGSREADNLIYLCWQHHRQLDRGLLRMVGDLENPVFLTVDGRRVGERLVPGDAARGPPPGASP